MLISGHEAAYPQMSTHFPGGDREGCRFFSGCPAWPGAQVRIGAGMCLPPGPACTEEAVFFSFLWRVHSPEETSSSVAVPSWEPQAMKDPLSCTRRLKRASSHTCWRGRAGQGRRESKVILSWSDYLAPGEAERSSPLQTTFMTRLTPPSTRRTESTLKMGCQILHSQPHRPPYPTHLRSSPAFFLLFLCLATLAAREVPAPGLEPEQQQ